LKSANETANGWSRWVVFLVASLYGIPVEMLTQGDKHLLYPRLT